FPISILPSEAGSLIWAGCKTRNRFTPSVKPSLWGCKRMKTSSLCAPGRRRMNDRQAKPIDGEDLTMKAFPFPDKISSRQELARDLLYRKIPAADREKIADQAWETGAKAARELIRS